MYDRVRAVDELQLLVVPQNSLGALVLAVPDLERLRAERGRRVVDLEDELDHLPVALVLVVEVVEGVEEPVLEREPTGVGRIGRDVRVDRRRGLPGETVAPPLVVAAWIERVAGEVQMVLVETFGEVLRGRRDPDQVRRPPRSAERDRGLGEEHVDVERHVRLAVAARLLLLDEPDDGRIALGERSFLALVGGRRRRRGERDEEREEEQQEALPEGVRVPARGHSLTPGVRRGRGASRRLRRRRRP
jgi:hypothetical protein